MCLYKCHVLPFIESGTPAYYHATSSILQLLDNVQNGFIESVGISKIDALLNFNLAPLGVRRDIAMLSVLHRIVLGIAPVSMRELIPLSSSTLFHHGFKSDKVLHDKQLQDCTGHNSPVMLKRSLFGLVYVYNRLKQDVVDSKSVKVFQSNLYCIVKLACGTNPKWEFLLHRE